MSKLLERLRKIGVPEADLEYLERQEAAAQRAKDLERETGQYRERFAYLQGMGQQGGKRQPSKFDQLMEAFGAHENGAELQRIFGTVREAILEEVEAKTDQKVRPLQERMGELTTTRQLEEYLETNMVPLYGEGIREFWPEIRREAQRELREQGTTVPELIAVKLDKERVAKILTGKATAERKRDDAGVLEGFHEIQRSRPSMSTGGSDDDDEERGEENSRRDGKGRFALKPFDATAVAADVLRAMGKAPSGG